MANWKVSGILPVGYYLFIESPAKGAEFAHVSGLSFFSAKFVERSGLKIQLWHQDFSSSFYGLKKYIEKAKKSPRTLSNTGTVLQRYFI